MNWALVLGLTATALSFASGIPQFYRMLRFHTDPRALLGLSVMTPLIAMSNEVCVFIYGWSLGEVPLWLPQCFAIPFHVFVIAFLLRSRLMLPGTEPVPFKQMSPTAPAGLSAAHQDSAPVLLPP